jgi:hypothetical protein
MPGSSIIRVLLLRDAIYRTMSAEERCLVALDQLEAALNALLPGSVEPTSKSAPHYQYREAGSSSR